MLAENNYVSISAKTGEEYGVASFYKMIVATKHIVKLREQSMPGGILRSNWIQIIFLPACFS